MLNDRFFTKFEKTIIFLLNEQFYGMKDFPKQLFSEKTNEIYGKLMIILITNEINIFLNDLKNEQNESLTNDEKTKRTKGRTRPTLYV